MQKELVQQQLLEYHPKSSFTVICKGSVVNIGFDEVCYIIKSGNVCYIHTTTGKFETLYSLQEILNDLPVNDFFRVNKSNIISLKKIACIERDRVRIDNRWFSFSKYYQRQMKRDLALLLNTQYSLFTVNKKL